MVGSLVEMLTILPKPRATMPGTAARAMWKAPLRLVSTMLRQAAGSVSQKRAGSVLKRSLTRRMPRPALFTTTAGGPKRAVVSATRASQAG